MANPVGGHTNPPPPNPDQPPRDSIWERIGFFVKEIFSRFPQPEPSPLPYQASAGGVRPSKEGILTQWLESQPENAKAEAQKIVSMLLQKNLKNLFELNIQNYHNITSFPNVLQNCTKLKCISCTSLQMLPELPACLNLNCDGCISLQTLPALPVCEELSLARCKSLVTIPTLLNCYGLICPECTSLQALPELPVCTWLDCGGCTSLETLPKLPVCNGLYCLECTSLQALPELPVCTWLDCRGCTSLRALPELPRCVELICRVCTSLQVLPPALPRCERLNCSNCTSLRALPELRNCHTLDCENCPLLVNIPPHLNRQDMIPRDIRAQADVHYGDRDERTRDALTLLWQTRLNADQINRQFKDFIRYFDGLAHSEKKAKANLALRVPKENRESFGPLLDNIPFSIRGFMLEGKELIARLWNFISSLDLQEQPLAKEGILTALSDSFAPNGDRVCNQGKTQRLCICVLQGRLRGVQIDDLEIPNPDLATSLNLFFANEERRGMEPHQLREQARLYCDQNPLVAREEFLAQVEEFIRLRE